MKPANKKNQTKPAARKTAPPASPADVSVGQSVTAMVMGVILVGSLGAFVYGNERSDVMLAVSHEARGVTSLRAMDTPNIGSDALLNWCKFAVSEIFTYNFNDISPRMLGAQRLFTKAGWDSFLLAMYEQQVLEQVQSQRQFVATIPGADAVISSEGEVSGTYFWSVQVDTVTSVYTGTSRTRYGTLNLKVARIPTKKSDSGYPFGIVQVTQ